MIEHTSADQILIRKLSDIILVNLEDEKFSVKELAGESGLSRYTLSRRLHSIANKTASQFIRETRLRKALEMLQNSGLTAAEVAYKTGFSSPTYFNTCFHEYFGFSPGTVKKESFDKNIEIKSVADMAKRKERSPRIAILILSGLLSFTALGYLAYKFIIKNPSNTLSASEIPVKTLAVLPFHNLGGNPEDQYFIDGVMEEILTNLSRIHELSVISRTSVEQFRESAGSAAEIARKLKADYIVEGSGQKYGNTFRLRVQLIEASNDRHLWAESYEEEILGTKDIFNIQSQVAQKVAAELEATLTPEEKLLIERTPTLSFTAYDYYQRGSEELRKYRSDSNKQSLFRAEEMYKKALKYDSEFARAYIGLADVYYERNRNASYYSENYLDSMLILANIALTYDAHLAEAFFARGNYYLENGKGGQSIKEFEKALRYMPNYWEVYWMEGWKLFLNDYENMDFVKGLQYIHKAIRLNRGNELPVLINHLGDAYNIVAGFPEKAKYYYREALSLDGDTIVYLVSLGSIEFASRNYEGANEMYLKWYLEDTNNVSKTALVAYTYYFLGQINESLKYYKKIENRLDFDQPSFHGGLKRIGYVYWQTGDGKEANRWFNEQIRMSNESLKMGRFYSADANYDLASVYAFTGEKDKAYENLRIMNKIHLCPLWLLNSLKDDPLFESTRNEPGFQKIVSDMESKYQAEHERVKKWLEEQGEL